MAALKLFENEELITQSTKGKVVLTNMRIRYSDEVVGRAHIVSIMLEKISSIEIHYRSWWLALLVGIIALVAGVASLTGRNDGELAMILFVVGALSLIFYFTTRKHIVSVSSDGGAKINFETSGMSREDLLKFVGQIEEAKNNRVKEFIKI